METERGDTSEQLRNPEKVVKGDFHQQQKNWGDKERYIEIGDGCCAS